MWVKETERKTEYIYIYERKRMSGRVKLMFEQGREKESGDDRAEEKQICLSDTPKKQACTHSQKLRVVPS